MKKILVLAVLLLPAIPSFIVGIESQTQTTEELKQAMLEQRFEQFCKSHGKNYATMTEHEKDAWWGDVWMEFEDYENAIDSIDSVLSIKTALNQAM